MKYELIAHYGTTFIYRDQTFSYYVESAPGLIQVDPSNKVKTSTKMPLKCVLRLTDDLEAFFTMLLMAWIDKYP